jgi:hypothetical protein
MSASQTEVALDIVDLKLGIATQGDTSGVGFRLFLRDGKQLVFALTEAQTLQFARAIQEALIKLRTPSSGGSKH